MQRFESKALAVETDAPVGGGIDSAGLTDALMPSSPAVGAGTAEDGLGPGETLGA